MSRNPFGSELYRIAGLLSQRVSKNDPFFQDIALMEASYRKHYAILFSLIKTEKEGGIDLFNIDIENMDIPELIEKVIMPLVQRLGQSQFKADPLTHLGFKVGQDSIDELFKDDD